jgi:hypothetical protein
MFDPLSLIIQRMLCLSDFNHDQNSENNICLDRANLT